ncbi:DUF1552 domain-containing protein [Paraglaciecola aquimarina]|uniref:DUF1552 domain-containing protein n=1 Tax=Paraglaciecola algarum TaxID=3050085 RepID=A0ABS9D7P3_9ALTE|nr:DUF1552 domain-containing protein [Paraglaciecola sp. G1-23]MCF2947829.1 DUF1552 domain-containing protein [Paraglaciecola sp. G1-23]
MFITKKSISRRTLLKGMGVGVALPLLDAMIPAATALELTPAAPALNTRLGYIFVAMGADMSRFTPKSKSNLDIMSPILESLAAHKDHLNVITNTFIENAYPGSHATSNSAFLSCARAKLTESTDYYLGTTVDQLAAQQIGQQTQLPSIEMGMDLLETVGQCDNGYACVYQNNLSWSSPTTPLPSEAHPRLVFERLFGAGGDIAARQKALNSRNSLLDSVMSSTHSLNNQVGSQDKLRIDEYLTSVREVERRIQLAYQGVEKNHLPTLNKPMGVPKSYSDHAKLMLDLQVLAMQADITRVSTLQLVREASTRTYPEIGVADSHHPLSHHGNDPTKLARMAKVNAYHASLFAYLVDKLANTPDGEGKLIDNTMYLYGSGMGDPNLHDHHDLPIIVAGGQKLGFKGNNHVVFNQATPLANVHLTMLKNAGIDIDKFADSTGLVSEMLV